MKDKLPIIAWALVIIAALSALCYYIINKRNNNVSSRIVNYCNQNKDIKQIRLKDFTNFDWDEVVVYGIHASLNDIRAISKVDYNEDVDLSAGMIFIKNKKVVHKEIFQTDFESPYKFIIYPSKDNKLNVTKFKNTEATFDIKKIVYNKENRYILRPTNSIFVDYDNIDNTLNPKSYYQSYEVVDENVKIHCHLTIFNNENTDFSFIIRAEATKDVGKLLKDGRLKVKDGDKEKIFDIGANETLELDVTFEGEFGGIDQKADRLLPNTIKIIEIS